MSTYIDPRDDLALPLRIDSYKFIGSSQMCSIEFLIFMNYQRLFLKKRSL